MKKIIYSLCIIAFISTLFHLKIGTAEAQIEKSEFQFPITTLGNCKDESACKKYCDNPTNMETCIDFSVSHGLISTNESIIAKKAIEKIKKGETPGNCKDKKSCELFCQNDITNLQQCILFAEEIGISQEEIVQAKQIASALQKGAQLPGGCSGKQSCEAYCSNTNHIDECLSFAEVAQIISNEEIVEAKKIAPFLKNGETPGNCKSKKECQNYCENENNFNECINFAEKAELIPLEDIILARKTGGKGPGGCKTKESCEAFCNKEENAKMCADFAIEKQLVSEGEAKLIMGAGIEKIKDGLEKIPQEMKGEVESCLNSLFNGDFNAAITSKKTITKMQGEKVGSCFEEAAKKYADQQREKNDGVPTMTTPPNKEELEKMMKGAPESIQKEIQKNIEQKYKEEFEKRVPKNIPVESIPNMENLQKQIPDGVPQEMRGAPCSSEAECRAMFGGGPPFRIPQ